MVGIVSIGNSVGRIFWDQSIMRVMADSSGLLRTPLSKLVDPEKVVFIQPGIAGGELGGLVG
jgi:hypothetical protein